MISANPDGYEYSRNGDRLWRKTRSDIGHPFCKGVDGNRNWDYKWGHKAGNSLIQRIFLSNLNRQSSGAPPNKECSTPRYPKLPILLKGHF